ncbi:hypothetical protein F5883DRAFT_139553 [Diaporthe sp. PMI_573]|nr:hypothetical protein F5883DRAFT_139553 [Diaporthaceae sp. PMI_573]
MITAQCAFIAPVSVISLCVPLFKCPATGIPCSKWQTLRFSMSILVVASHNLSEGVLAIWTAIATVRSCWIRCRGLRRFPCAPNLRARGFKPRDMPETYWGNLHPPTNAPAMFRAKPPDQDRMSRKNGDVADAVEGKPKPIQGCAALPRGRGEDVARADSLSHVRGGDSIMPQI